MQSTSRAKDSGVRESLDTAFISRQLAVYTPNMPRCAKNMRLWLLSLVINSRAPQERKQHRSSPAPVSICTRLLLCVFKQIKLYFYEQSAVVSNEKAIWRFLVILHIAEGLKLHDSFSIITPTASVLVRGAFRQQDTTHHDDTLLTPASQIPLSL